MIYRKIALVAAVSASLAVPGSLAAQDAAETAVILSGSSGQSKAANSLGNAVRGSVNSAADAIRAVPRNSANRSTARTGNRRGPVQIQTAIPTNDPLENTDATRFQTGSGATISVSGRMRPSAAARCIENCGTDSPTEQPGQDATETQSAPE